MNAIRICRERADESVETATTEKTCPECGGQVSHQSGEWICEACGLVVDTDRIDRGPEWRSFDAEERKRTGPARTEARHDRGLTTRIGHETDAYGSPLSERKRTQLRRLRREHRRAQCSTKPERNLRDGITDIRRVASALGLSDAIRNQACRLFRTAQSEDLLVGRSIEGIAAASVYGICRCHGLPQRLDDVAAVAQVEQSRVRHCYQVLNAELGLPAEPVPAREYVPQLASALECPPAVRRRAESLAAAIDTANLVTGANPVGVAAGCLYQASREEGEGLTQRSIADAAGISPSTLRKHWRTLTDEVL